MDFHDFEVYVKEIGDKKLMNISRDTYEIISGRLPTLYNALLVRDSYSRDSVVNRCRTIMDRFSSPDI